MQIQRENFGQNNILQFNYEIYSYNFFSHIHQYAEIVYCIDGEIIVTVNDTEICLREREYLFIMPLQVHGFVTPGYCNIVVSAFSTEHIPELSGQSGWLKGSGKNGIDSCFRYTFMEGGLGAVKFDEVTPMEIPEENHLRNYINLNDSVYLVRFKAAIYSLLGRCENKCSTSADTQDALANLLIWLGDHYTEHVSLSDATSALGYSRNYLSHRIKKLSGMSFPDILSNLRVEYSRDLLLRGMTVLDAALESGFETERSFYRAFRKITGMTPGEYVKGKKQ